MELIPWRSSFLPRRVRGGYALWCLVCVLIEVIIYLDSLDTNDKVAVLNALTGVQSRYYEIGTQLHLKSLDTIRNRSITDTIAMGGVVEDWLKWNYDTDIFGPPTWKMLVNVVANPSGGNDNFLAKKIAEEHRKRASNPRRNG